MARSRNIKPGFFKNEDLAECSPWARLCFAGLWTLADREGRLEDRPKRIKAELFAFDTVEVEPMLDELVRYGFITRYAVNGQRFIQVAKFQEHQTPHYTEKPSAIPGPELQESVTHEAPELQESSKSTADNSGSLVLIKGGSKPPDSLIPDSLIPDSLRNTRAEPTPEPPPPAPRASRSAAMSAADLIAEGVSKVDAESWLTSRKARRLPLTPAAWAAIKAEAAKARITPADAVARSAANGWAGFKASWLTQPAPGAATPVTGRQSAIEQHNRNVAAAWLAKQGGNP